MPSAHPPAHPYPGTVWTLQKAADEGQIVILKCNLCKRSARYLATDLVTLLNPQRDALAPPFTCSRCRRSDYLHVKLTYPLVDDYGQMAVRRPGRVRQVQTWRWVKLGEG